MKKTFMKLLSKVFPITVTVDVEVEIETSKITHIEVKHEGNIYIYNQNEGYGLGIIVSDDRKTFQIRELLSNERDVNNSVLGAMFPTSAAIIDVKREPLIYTEIRKEKRLYSEIIHLKN